MSTTAVSASARTRPGVMRLMVPLAALALTLAGCGQAGPTAEPTEQESVMASATPEPSVTGTTPTARPSAGPTTTSSASPEGSDINAMLTISIRQDADAEPEQYVLECVDGEPGPASTLPDADAACDSLAQLGTDFFTARPDKDRICTQQYGGPQTASITGTLSGTPVSASFSLTDGCEIARWNDARDILGEPGTL